MMDMVPTRTLQEIQIELENMKQKEASRGTAAALTGSETTHDHEEERKDSDREEGASSLNLWGGMGAHHDDLLMERENVAMMFHRDDKWKEGRRNACAKKMTGLNAPSVRAEKRQRASNEAAGPGMFNKENEVISDGTEEEEEVGEGVEYTNVKKKKNARQQGRGEKKRSWRGSDVDDDDDYVFDDYDDWKEGRKVSRMPPPLYLTKKDLLERRKRIQSLLDFTLANQQEKQQT